MTFHPFVHLFVPFVTLTLTLYLVESCVVPLQNRGKGVTVAKKWIFSI